MARTTQQMWLEEGLSALHKQGVDGLTVDNLCQRLNKTKGSFYHHFTSREGYVTALLDYWEEEQTSKFIEYSEQGQTPQEKIRRLFGLTLQPMNEPEVAIRAWALQDPLVRTYQERVDKRRIMYVEKLYFELTGDAERARVMGYMIYAVKVGSQQIIPPPNRNMITQMYQLLEQLAGFSPDI